MYKETRGRASLGFGSMIAFAVLTVSVLSADLLPDQGGTGGGGDRFWASLVDPNAPGGTRTAPVVIRINEYSSDAEIQQLARIRQQKGPDELRKALWNLEKGFIRVDGGLGYPIAVARSRPTENGRRIVLLMDRPVQFWELWNNTRSADYPFSFIEIDLGRNGEGEGRLIAAAKVWMTAGGNLDIESLGAQPARLLNVRTK